MTLSYNQRNQQAILSINIEFNANSNMYIQTYFKILPVAFYADSLDKTFIGKMDASIDEVGDSNFSKVLNAFNVLRAYTLKMVPINRVTLINDFIQDKVLHMKILQNILMQEELSKGALFN
jgi:hypothetical protein